MGFGSNSSSSVSGYSALPPELQNMSMDWITNLYNQYNGGSGSNQQQQQIQGLNDVANTDLSSSLQYYNDVLGGKYTDLSTNQAYQDAVKSITQNYNEELQKSLGTVYANANKAGGYFSTYTGDQANQTADQANEDLANALATQGLDVYNTERGYQNSATSGITDLLNQISSLKSTALGASQTSYNQLLQLLSALSGTQASSSGFNVSLV